MIKRSTLVASALVVCAGAFALAAAPGCSSDKSEETPPAGGGAGIKPAARPSGEKTGTTQWFALKALKLGVTTRDGKATRDAWKDYGYDLDGRITTEADSQGNVNTCKRKAGAGPKALTDGNQGRDNNFGQHVMSTIKSLKSDAEEAVTGAITDGDFTLLVKIENFTTEDNAKAPGTVYVANKFKDGAEKPTFGADETGWQIVKDTTLTFPNAYIANGQWVSGDFGSGTINLNISLAGAEIKLPIDSGIITFKVDGTEGTIAGAMNTDKLKDALTPVAKQFGICPGTSTFETVVNSLTSSADLVSDKPNLQDPAAECNAISIALGFEATKTGDHSSAPVITPDTTGGGDECSGEDAGPADGG